jgi:hypothetical protein
MDSSSLLEGDWLSRLHLMLFLNGLPLVFVVGGIHGEITVAGTLVIYLWSFTHSLSGVILEISQSPSFSLQSPFCLCWRTR